MNVRTSFLTRCLALVLALVLVASSANLGVTLRVLAADNAGTEVTAGELVAMNYELTDAEKALLNSGNLAGDSYSYTVPSNDDDLVSVDTEGAKITVKSYKSWVPTTASIIVDGQVVETVTLADGEGTYKYDGNAFSVEVTYELYIEVADQENLLNAAAWLKQGVANTEAVSGQQGNLYILEQAMPELVNMADQGFDTGNAYLGKIQLSDAGKAAIKDMNAQMTANGGKLDLSVMIDEYVASTKTGYLLSKGAAMHAEVVDLAAKVSTVSEALNTIASNLDTLISMGLLDATLATQLKTLSNSTNNLIAGTENAVGLKSVAAADWTAADKGTALVSASVNYAALDTLVAAVENTTAATAKNPLLAASTSVRANLSMKNVEVSVVLMVVDGVDSAELVAYGEAQTVALTLDENISAEQILAAIQEAGVEADAKAAWGEAYVAEHYEAEYPALPDSLTEDIEYTITYVPVNYAVTYGYETEAPTSVPYGYQLTLPAHEDAEQAYDYQVNGETYAQGEVYTIVGDTEISRSAGKAYSNTDLYSVIADNFGNDIAKDILKSGALLNNEAINVRKPDPADAASLLTLLDGVLTAKSYNASYEGLTWAPYTYGANGNENKFSGSTASWSSKEAKVQYILSLENVSVEEVDAVLALAAQLKAEADAQVATLDSFAANYEVMGQLNRTMLAALNGVIDATDLTPGDDNYDDAKNLELRAYFKGLISNIINNSLDKNNQLKIYNLMGNYSADNGGLGYYYRNSEAFISEINALSSYLTGLLADDEKIVALQVLLETNGYGQYNEKITSLESKLAEVKAALTAPNAAIDLTSPNLGKLVDALVAEGEVETAAAATPYLLSDVLTALDDSQVMVQVIMTAGKASATASTPAYDRDTVLTQDAVNTLKAAIDAFVAANLGDKAAYYTVEVVGGNLDALVGTGLTNNVNIYYNYTVKSYNVEIEGEDSISINIDNLEITLPAHDQEGYTYDYIIGGNTYRPGTYKFTAAQLDELFVNGSYTITRVEINEADDKLEDAFGESEIIVLNKDENGKLISVVANVDSNKEGIMGFAMELMNAGYANIKLNGKDFMYENEGGSLEISLQSLIDALLNDNSFGSETLIKVGKEGKGKLVSTNITLDGYGPIPFELWLTSVPSQMGTVSSGLNAVKNYMTFQSQNGVMNVDLNLPEKVYEVYLTALLATGNVDKSDINAINSEIAYQFLYDYVDTIISSDADTKTFTNTLKMVGVDSYDLTQYEKYYGYVKKALTNEGVVINAEDVNGFDLSVTGKGKDALALFNLIGFDLSSFETYISMVKEFKDGGVICGAVDATLKNTTVVYEAVVLDLNASGVQNKFDYTNNLPARVKSIAGAAIVILLDDVDGDLSFGATTILDLNGKNVNGSISSTGDMLIMDSSMGTAAAGTVTGSVSGDIKVIGGNYAKLDSAYLAEGYELNGTTVQNKLYTIESNGNDVTFVLNTDVIDEAKAIDSYTAFAEAVAIDLAADLVLNYITSAAMSADGNTIYNFTVKDLIGWYAGANRAENMINQVMNFIDAEDLTVFVNSVIDDMMDFAAIEKAINNNQNVVEYELTTMPWSVAVEHVTDGDYITFGIEPNAKLAKSFKAALKLDGSNKAYIANLAGGLSEIVTENTDISVVIDQPTYANRRINVSGSGKAVVELDVTKDQNTENELHFSAKDYTTVLAVILANGNPEDAEALLSNINNKVELKKVIDEISVEDIFSALKALDRHDTFKSLADEMGLVDGGQVNDFVDKGAFDDEEALESIYHIFAVGAGWMLEKLDITGYTGKKLGSLDKDDDGVYELTVKNKNPSAGVSFGGYGVNADVEVEEITLSVKLFGGLLGDVDSDNDVDNVDAMLALQYYVELINENALDLSVCDVDGNGAYDNVDAMLILQYYVELIDVFPVEK